MEVFLEIDRYVVRRWICLPAAVALTPCPAFPDALQEGLCLVDRDVETLGEVIEMLGPLGGLQRLEAADEPEESSRHGADGSVLYRQVVHTTIIAFRHAPTNELRGPGV